MATTKPTSATITSADDWSIWWFLHLQLFDST
jgi:hypothetical protein